MGCIFIIDPIIIIHSPVRKNASLLFMDDICSVVLGCVDCRNRTNPL